MGTREKLLIYPYDIQSAPVVRHLQLLGDYDLIGVVSPNGWGLCGKDAGHADFGEKVGFDISDNFEQLLQNCDTVLFSESYLPLHFEKMIQSKLELAIAQNKNVISTLPIPEELYHSYQQQCDKLGTYFLAYGNTRGVREEVEYYGYILDDQLEFEHIYPIDTPVIFVLGMSERCHKLELQLALREQILHTGYKVSQVGSRSYCEMFGFHSIPEYMFTHQYPEHKKVVMFNHFIKAIELKEKPDLIVIGVPGGLFPFNDEFTNKFGLLAYEISRAVQPDTALLSVLYEDYKPEYYTELSKTVKYRFGAEIDCFNLANVKFDWDGSSQNRMLSYNMIESQYVSEAIKQYDMLHKPVYNVFCQQDAEHMVKNLLNQLAEYANVQSV